MTSRVHPFPLCLLAGALAACGTMPRVPEPASDAPERRLRVSGGDPALSRCDLLRSKRQRLEITFRAYVAMLKDVEQRKFLSFSRDGRAWRIHTSGHVSQSYI